MLVRRLLPLALSALLAVSCSRARDLFSDDWNDYESKVTPLIEPLRTELDGLEKRLNDLNPQKVNHPLVAAYREKMNAALGEYKNNVKRIDALIHNEKQELNGLLDKGQLEEGKQSFSEFKSHLDATIVTTRASAEVAQKELDDFSDRIDHRERSLKAFSVKKGKADFRAIEFRIHRADFDFTNPLSETTLNELVSFAKSCPELRFEIVGHSGREGPPEERERVSIARANFVKNFLVRKGVPKDVIDDTSGVGNAHPLVREPEPNSNEEKNMDEAKLKQIRAQNRRVDIVVTEPCGSKPPLSATDAGSDEKAKADSKAESKAESKSKAKADAEPDSKPETKTE